ncbi:MAG: endopeptidase La [Dehalococcoidales bacterium]|nr:endopeptidase La [Dehalococcoidales bacterium]
MSNRITLRATSAQQKKNYSKRSRKEAEHTIQIPNELPVIPLHSTVIFPHMIIPLRIGRPVSLHAVEEALSSGRPVLLLAEEGGGGRTEVRPEDLYRAGTVAHITQSLRLPEGDLQVLVQGQMRAQVIEFTQTDPVLRARIELVEPTVKKTVEIEALMRSVQSQFDNYVELNREMPEEAATAVRAIEDPGTVADAAALAPDITHEQRQKVLETFDPAERLRLISVLLSRQIEVLQVKNKIQSEVQKGVDKMQRDYYLREQLRAIQRELGEDSPEAVASSELQRKIEAAGMPEEVKEKALREVERLGQMPSASPETAVIRTYLEWLVSLPWSVQTQDNLDLSEAARILDQDHYGLRRVKERILEYLAVRKLSKTMRSPLLCFVGPPGVGKTSLGKSIARAMGRKFVRMSLGGVRDEAEIRGHRRTYVGALPGRIIQGIRTAGSRNPVFMLDEVDKIGVDFRGDPSAALLEVLDPEQNFSFSDHYLEAPFDLSQVIFVMTANRLDTVPPALRDRMEIIEIPGYTEEEKLQIAERYLVPKQIEAHGITSDQVKFTHNALRSIIREYTKEAGVRNLEREIASVIRKIARRIAEGKQKPVVVRQSDLHQYLGPTRYLFGSAQETDEVGVATGVAWTPVGGDTIFVEVNAMEGRPELILTGQLGEVMQESAKAALSYARSRAKELGIDPKVFENHAVHIHVPAGAIPKDGPSAGITMATALISAFTGRPVSKDVAMTGEITLRGRVLPIGGVKEKMLAAHAAGIRTFILPEKNSKDLEEVPKTVTKNMNVILVKDMDEVLNVALLRDVNPREKAA